jgi:hypothetical protein
MNKLSDADFVQYVSGFDIVCFIETFLEYKTPLDCFQDFIQFFSPSIKLTHQGRSSGGVLIMVKRTFEKLVTELTPTQDNMVWLKLNKDFFGQDKDVILEGVYICPPGSPYYEQEHVHVTTGISFLEDSILNLIPDHQDCTFLLCGDFNARTGNLNTFLHQDDTDDVLDYVRADTTQFRRSEDKMVNANGQLLLDVCFACNFKILNGCCKGDYDGRLTFVGANGSSTVDYFICSDDLFDDNTAVRLNIAERFDSTHMPVELTVGDNTTHAQAKPLFIEKTAWDEKKKGQFLAAVNSEDFRLKLDDATAQVALGVDNAVDIFVQALAEATSCMKRRVYCGPRQSKWYDHECRESKRTTRRSWRRFRLSRQDASRRQFVESRSQYRKLLKTKRQTFKESKLRSLAMSASDSKLFWSEVRALRSSKQEQPNISNDEWLNHFRGVLGADADDQGHGRPGDDVDDIRVDELDSDITADEVRRAVRHLRSGKAPGLDNILTDALKASIDQILPFILSLFNHVFATGNYPGIWTRAVIVPIHKSGSKDNPDNYRGISLLSVLGKVFSHILNERLTLWSDANNKIVEETGRFPLRVLNHR